MTPPRELVVISGKGGTGKTSFVAAFAALAGGAVLADCDVDAADLHLVLRPETGQEHPFSGRHQAIIDPETCTACGRCAEVCRFAAVLGSPLTASPSTPSPARAASFAGVSALPRRSRARRQRRLDGLRDPLRPTGPRSPRRRRGQLGQAVTLVRNEARRVAEERGLPLIIVDGSPGIGCPVISSLAGADLVLAVTEPTVSGRHDLDRVLQVVRQFRLPFAVCVNKADLNPELGDQTPPKRRRPARNSYPRRLRPGCDARPGGRHRFIDYGGRAATRLRGMGGRRRRTARGHGRRCARCLRVPRATRTPATAAARWTTTPVVSRTTSMSACSSSGTSCSCCRAREASARAPSL